jgi:beta-lactamase class D
LRISADEQVDFMEGLASRRLPFRPPVLEAVDAMILQQPGTIARGEPIVVDVAWDGSFTQLYAKTGSSDDGAAKVRWLVGHIAAGGHAYAFASVVVARAELSTEAVTLAMHELRDAGLVEAKR